MQLNDKFNSPRGGTFFINVPYLRGARDVQNAAGFRNPYPPGPELAQYNYGYANELQGDHDDIDLPFEEIDKVPPPPPFRHKR